MSVLVQNSPVLVQVADDQIRVFGLGGSTPSAHVHSASDITSGTLDASRLPTGIDAAKIGGGTISNAEFACLDGATSPLQAQLDTAAAGAAAQFAAISVSLAGKANTSHTHSAADITSGVVAPARLGSGTPTSATLLDGSGAWRGLAASDVPSLDASKITSGTLNAARLPSQLTLTSISATDSSGISLQSDTGTVVAVVSPTNLQTNRLGGRSQRLGVGGGPGGGQGVCEVWSSLSVASGVGFGTFPDPGPGGIYAQSRLRLGAAATVDTASSELVGTAQGLVLHSATGLSNRLQVGGVTNSNFGASFGTVGASRFAIGQYAVGAATDDSKSGIASDGAFIAYNADNVYGHRFRANGSDRFYVTHTGNWQYAAPASDVAYTLVSNSYYSNLNFTTSASSPAGAGTQGVLRGYGGQGFFIYGYPSLSLRSTSSEGLFISDSLAQFNRNLSFTSGFGIPEEALRSYANGGPNLVNESLKQLRNGTIFSSAVNTGAAVQTRTNSVDIPGGAAIVYSGTGSQPTIYLGESFVAVDTTKTYLLRGWLANTVNTTQQSYIGLLCYNSAGTILSYIYPAANAVVAPSGGQWYQGYVSGTVFPAGTRYVRVATLIGYGSPSGAWTTRTSPIEFVECPAQCGAFHNATQSLADTTWTAASFNSEILDTSNLHDTSTNTDRVNVPRTGKYRITAQAEFAANATGYRQARITVNGSALARSTKIVPNNGASLEAQAGIEIYAVLTAGDIVRLEAYQDSGGSLNLTSNTRLYLLWISD